MFRIPLKIKGKHYCCSHFFFFISLFLSFLVRLPSKTFLFPYFFFTCVDRSCVRLRAENYATRTIISADDSTMMQQKLRNPGRACRLKNPLRFRSRNSCSTVHSILLFLNLINSRSISRMRPRGSPSRNHWREGNVFTGEIENAREETSAAAAAAAARKINRLTIARYSRSLHKPFPPHFPARCYFFFWFFSPHRSIG